MIKKRAYGDNDEEFIKERGGTKKLESNLANLANSMKELQETCVKLSESGAFSMISKFFRKEGNSEKLKDVFNKLTDDFIAIGFA